MAFYEVVYVTRPDLSRNDVEKLTNSMVGIVEEQKGRIVKNEYWGLRSLAYKIKKNGKGHYGMLGIEASGAALAELERNLRINEDVIRHLSVRMDTMDESPSVVLRQQRYDTNEAA